MSSVTLKPRLRGPEQITTSDQDFRAWEHEFDRTRPRLIDRLLGRRAVELVQRDALLNHDPLAHVWQTVENGGVSNQLATKFKTEFLTDIAERSPDAGFYTTFEYRVTADDLVSDVSGLKMREILARSIDATRQDVQKNKHREYGLRRELVQQRQLDDIIEWYHHSSDTLFGYASLCPSSDEQPVEVARANGFKSDRMMASLWVYERARGSVKMHAFSLDQCTLPRLQRALVLCGIEHTVGSDTLAQLAQAIRTSSCSPEDIKEAYQEVLRQDGLIDERALRQEATSQVEQNPQAFKLHMDFTLSIVESLKYGAVTKQLADLLSDMRSSFTSGTQSYLALRRNRRLSVDDARNIMEFVRSRAIPHFVYAVSEELKSSGTSISDSAGSAHQRTESYEGSCPMSSYNTLKVEASALSRVGLINISVIGSLKREQEIEEVWKTKRRGDCVASPDCPEKKTTVYGCGFCEGCSKVWCGTYKQSGRMLTVSEVGTIARRNKKSVVTTSNLLLKPKS